MKERTAYRALIRDAAGSAWRTGPGPEHIRATMARALFWMFAAGAALALLVLPFSGYMSAGERLGDVVASGVAVGACVVLRFGWRRLPMWAFHVLLGLGAVIVTVGIYVSRDLPGAAQVFYIWVALYASYFLTRGQALAHVAFVGALYAAVLPTTAGAGSYLPRWLIVVGTLAGTSILVSELKRRLDRRMEERMRSESELEQSLSILRSTLESTADGILVVDGEGGIVSFNGKFQEMWRIPEEIVTSRDDDRAIAFVLDQLADPDQFVAKVHELYGRPEADSSDVLHVKDGRVFERYSLPQRAGDGRILGRVWSFRDVTERERIQSQLRHLADHDVLTGLLNRRRFEEELARHVAYEERYGTGGAVLVLDLDDFKEVNDTRGHGAGDAVISSVANLLRERLRQSDVLARLGGDEFAILLPTATQEQAQLTGTSLLEAVRTHRLVPGGQPVRVTTSIGAALVSSASADSAEELMVRADVAMYEAKESGRDRLSFYEESIGRRARMEASMTWSERIRRALEEDEFSLHVQPILDLRSGEVSQYELLLRMAGEGGELVPPRGFLPSAERCGLIHEIDIWVTRNAIRLLDEHRPGGRDLRLEVNLSGRTIADPAFLQVVEQALASATIDPANLIFEVAETAAISNMQEVSDFSRAVHGLGCRFALDDFGAGFGSFQYLKYMPIDYLKIDGDFIANLARNPTDQAVVRAIVDLSGRIGKETIAEFVGDEETVELLREYGVGYAQGYHVGRPVPVSEALAPSGAAATGVRA